MGCYSGKATKSDGVDVMLAKMIIDQEELESYFSVEMAMCN